jgi:hypothetical protein
MCVGIIFGRAGNVQPTPFYLFIAGVVATVIIIGVWRERKKERKKERERGRKIMHIFLLIFLFCIFYSVTSVLCIVFLTIPGGVVMMCVFGIPCVLMMVYGWKGSAVPAVLKRDELFDALGMGGREGGREE